MITVNYAYARYGTSSNPVAAAAQLAADWVRYDKGRTKFWEIGNENGGPWEASYKINTATNQDEPGVPKWNARPAFYYLTYFQKCIGDQVIATAVQGDTTDLLAYASLYSSGQAAIVLINKGGTNSQTLKINISTFTAGNRYYWYTLQGGSDGDFSRKVLINGIGPSLSAGGPDNYASLAAFSASALGDILVSVRARGAVFMMIEKK